MGRKKNEKMRQNNTLRSGNNNREKRGGKRKGKERRGEEICRGDDGKCERSEGEESKGKGTLK